MSESRNMDNVPGKGQLDPIDSNIAASSSEVSNIAGSVKTTKTPQRISSSSERQIKVERAQKCLENAALVSKRIKEHRKATAELLGRPFEDDDGGDTASEIASTRSERTGYSVATDTSTTMSVQDALNIPGISESLANTLKQKEILMERIKQYKEISKRPAAKSSTLTRRESTDSKIDFKKSTDNNEQLKNTLKDKENALSVMQVKIKAMETTILDLQEKINEKDQIIEAKNKATTLISDSLSKKEKDTLVLLEDTRQQMTKMQENFITMETEWKEEKQRLLNDIKTKDEKIKSLEETNTILETSRFEISVEHSKLLEELEVKNKKVLELETKIENLNQALEEKPSVKEKDDYEEEKGTREISDMVELSKKIELLEQLNCQIRQTNKELENKLTTINVDVKPASPSKKGSPLPSRKGRNTASKLKSPWSKVSSESLPQETDKKLNKSDVSRLEMLVQSLNKDILEKEYVILQKDELIAELRNASRKEPPESGHDMVDIGISTEIVHESEITPTKDEHSISAEISIDTTPKEPADMTELETSLKEAQDQIALLTSDLEAANKNMLKVKSNHKLKLKQMQKIIDNFSKVSDANAEIVKLNEELNQLTQKVAEVEEEKGNLQLHLVDYDSGRLTDSDIYKKLVEAENLADTRLKAISLLETQKFELVQELHTLKQKNIEMEDKLADISQLQTEQVSAEIKSVQLEEQVDKLIASQKELELIVQNLKLDKEQLNSTIKELQDEKEELNQKLENYIQENMDLTDKLEKLSAEKVSSAESIEIVESLTTQEKLELEEYNKGMTGEKIVEHDSENVTHESEQNIEELVKQVEELNKKIELFTHEREEVMEKMKKLSNENEQLHLKLEELDKEAKSLQQNIIELSNEKSELLSLNQELNKQIDELKRERVDIIKETAEMAKSINEDAPESASSEAQLDDKSANDKGMNRTKSVKQLTKEILKLKNTIKERENEIADCQMKILSLEEQQQKQNEMLQANSGNESKLKLLIDENNQLKEEIDNLKKNNESSQQYKQVHDLLQQELQKKQHEYSVNVSSRDARINELEQVLLEYEKQIFNYGNTLQQKDKDLAEYINQITKLNDVSQKLKSTIELLEEEKAKDQNADLVKSLNKQIVAYQKKMAENEEKLRKFEEEISQLNSLKAMLENKNLSLDGELKQLQETLNEKQNLILELQTHQQKYSEELSAVKTQTKERDEEIHEIKLQLRKESIENEKLHTKLEEKDEQLAEMTKTLETTKANLATIIQEKDSLSEQLSTIEAKNKELLEKLKKFAANIKKKSAMYSDLEKQLIETQKQLELQNQKLEQYSIQVETLPALEEKLKLAEEEVNRLQSQRASIEHQKSQEIAVLHNQMKYLEDSLCKSSEEIGKLNDSINILHKDLHYTREENTNLHMQLDNLNKKIVEHELEQKNNANFVTKISSLEIDINEKQRYIAELLDKLENYQQQDVQAQFGYDAKIQERDLYIETLETEINKYKSRICRLEESISVMEDRRHSLERKADQLDNQLQEKEKAYAEYTNQEDELVARLAVLMDHDRVVDKQLHEIERDNKNLQEKLQQINDENQRLKKSLTDIQEYCNTLVDKASKFDFAEAENNKYKSRLHELEAQLKRVVQENHILSAQRKKEIEELEVEFNTQIENAFKEKKLLGEKHEKLTDHANQLEAKLLEYKTNNDNLNANFIELNRVHREYIEKTNQNQKAQSQDYTEQYIHEINNLNAVINRKNQEISDLSHKIQNLQSSHLSVVSNLESKIANLMNNLHSISVELDSFKKDYEDLKQNNAHLQNALSEQEKYLKELKDKKKLSFEMNIPKTEGMVITSTIEAMSEEAKPYDMSSLESEIISEGDIETPEMMVKKTEELVKAQSASSSLTATEQPIEPVIVPKKTYLCYQGDDNKIQEPDPFNSDEGWGLGEPEVTDDVTPGMSHLNEQIIKLNQEKDALKADLHVSNSKLMKAMKKLKELKASNDMLSNELRLSKQISQSLFLDSAIEDELKLKVEELEKTILELTSDLNKEKKEKESLRKQNEVFNNANDKLTEMKEKLDSELELWKYKFKEANDKVSTFQWGADAKDSPKHQPTAGHASKSDDNLKSEILKLEKENDELQTMIDQLTTENKDLLNQNKEIRNEIENLKQQQSSCENCEKLKLEITELHNSNSKLNSNLEKITEKLQEIETRYNKVSNNYATLKTEYENDQKGLRNENDELLAKCSKLQEEIIALRKFEIDNENIISSFRNENDELIAKCSDLEEEIVSLRKIQMDNEIAQNSLQTENEELLTKCAKLEEDMLPLKRLEMEAKNKISSLLSELETMKTQILFNQPPNNTKLQDTNVLEVLEKYATLEEHFSQLKHQLGEANNQIAVLGTTKQNITQQSELYLEQIKELNSKVQNLNSENDNLLSTVAELRSSVSSAVDQRGFEIAELWKQHLAQREADFQKTELELRNQLNASEAKYEQLLDNMQSSSQEETNKLVIMEQVNSLQNKLQDKEEHLRGLQDKYSEVVSQLDLLRSEMQDEKITHENKLFEQQEEYEKLIQELNAKLKVNSDSYENSLKNIQTELTASNTDKEELMQNIEGLRNELTAAEVKINELSSQLLIKDNEIHQKTQDLSLTLKKKNEEFENVRQQLLQYEGKVEELSYEKESELAVLRLKMHESSNYYEKVQGELEKEKLLLTDELQAKISEILNLNQKITDLNKTLEEDSAKLKEMQVALETQEVEIVSLKDEIFNLQELLKASTSKIQKHVSFASDTKPAAEIETTDSSNKEVGDVVPVGELDLALYMLHQRDVRCEELTMELTQLLDERDTLQLRLSDSLRITEELKSKLKEVGLDDSFDSSRRPISEQPTFSIEKETAFVDVHRGQTSRSSSVSDPDGDKPKLQAKLSELRTVHHSRDYRLRQESELRQLDMQLMQRDFANLPPEAVEQLTQAHHTLSRDSQSTSTVLLNWLRGKSTPKVVHM